MGRLQHRQISGLLAIDNTTSMEPSAAISGHCAPLRRPWSDRRLVAGALAAAVRDDRTMDAVAVPNFDSWLMMSSRWLTDDAIIFTIRRSVPVTRWLSM